MNSPRDALYKVSLTLKQIDKESDRNTCQMLKELLEVKKKKEKEVIED